MSMTSADYKAWKERHGLTHEEAGRVLGVCRRTSINYANDRTKIPGAIKKLIEMHEKGHLN